MSTYGYMYKSVSTYNTVREDSRPAMKPFVPFVPKASSGNSEGYVTKKTIVPVSGRPCDDDDVDYKNHSYPSEAYDPARGGDDEYYRQRSPVHGSPHKADDFISKVHNEASRPRYQPTYGGGDYGGNKEGRKPIVGGAYDRPNGYGDYGNYGGNKEGHKPIGGTIRNDPNYDRRNGADGYGGDYGNYGDKEGRKPAVSTIRNIGSYNGPNGYGGYHNKEGHRPTSSPHKYDGYDGANNGGSHNNREGHRPVSGPYDGYDGANNGYGGGYGKHGNKEAQRPISGPYDGYDGANNGYGGGYGNHNNKEAQRPISSPVHGYDGANNGYGNYNNKEGHRPLGSIPRNDSYGYGGYNNNNNNHNKIIPGGGPWAPPPRKGTQLSEPTSDIGKAMELLKVAANVTPNNKHDGAADRSSSAPSNNWASSLISGSPRGEAKGKYDKGMEMVKEAERLKKIATGGNSPKPAAPAARDDATRYGNFNLSYRPRTPPKQVSFSAADGGRGVYDDDDREDIRHRRSYGNASPVIDSRYAKNLYGGATV